MGACNDIVTGMVDVLLSGQIRVGFLLSTTRDLWWYILACGYLGRDCFVMVFVLRGLLLFTFCILQFWAFHFVRFAFHFFGLFTLYRCCDCVIAGLSSSF